MNTCFAGDFAHAFKSKADCVGIAPAQWK